MQKKQASAILTPNPPPTRPQILASDEVATPSDTGPIATEDPCMSRNSHVNTEGELKLPKMCSQENDRTDSFDSLPNTFSAYCDNLKMQSSQFTPCSLPTQHCPSHLGHTGWSNGPQLNITDVKQSVNASGSLPHVSSQQINSSLSLTLPPSPEGYLDSEPEECDSTARPLKPPAINSAQHSLMAKHSLMANLASHPTQQTASNEDSLHGEASDDDDDNVHSDLTYQSSTTSGSTIRNPTTENSRNSSLSQAFHPPFLGMQPRTASLTTAASSEMTSFVDMHSAVGSHSNVTGDKQPQNSDQSAQALMNSHERQLSAHHSQPPTTHPNPSVNVLSHLEPAVVGLPPSKVSSMIDKSAEKYRSAATVVEAAHEADTIGAPASSSTAKQALAVSCIVGSSAVPSTLPDVHQQNSGYLGRNQYASSNIIHRNFGSMDFSDRIQMDSYQRKRDSQGT